MSTTTPARKRLKREECAANLCWTPGKAEAVHKVWAKLTGYECDGAGRCDLSAMIWRDFEAELAAKRAARDAELEARRAARDAEQEAHRPTVGAAI